MSQLFSPHVLIFVLRNKASPALLLSFLLLSLHYPVLKELAFPQRASKNQSHGLKVMKKCRPPIEWEAKWILYVTSITPHTLEGSGIPQRPLGLEQLGHTKGRHRQNSQELPASTLPTSKGDHPRPALPEAAKPLSPLVNHFQSYSRRLRAGTQKGLPPQESLALPTG